MAELKTKENDADVETFLNKVTDKQKREDCFTVLELMKKLTESEPKMWGDKIVGFGNYKYKYASGREGDWFIAGFSPRKANLTLYIMSGVTRYKELLAKLGKYKTGSSCIYINKLTDINLDVLGEMVEKSVEDIQKGNIKF